MSMSVSVRGGTPPAGSRPARSRRPRTDRMTIAWMVAGVVVALLSIVFRGVIPQAWWTTIHVVTLGVLSNGILQWSWYFSRSLLRLAPDSRAAGRDQAIRQVSFNAWLVLLTAGMWSASLVLVLVGAAGIGIVLIWHTVALLMALRTKLGSRFAVVIRYYVAAGVSLVVGCILAGMIAASMFAGAIPQWLVEARGGLTVAHALVNALGWVGLSIAGTLVTLGPTILRVRLEPGAVERAVSALPVLALALVGMVIAGVAGLPRATGICLLAYAAGVAWAVGVPLAAAARRASGKRLEYAGKSLLAGIAATTVGLAALAIAFLIGSGEIPGDVLGLIGAGGVLTIFLGALSYLMPVVIGGGPRAVKAGIASIEVGGTFRLTLRYGALLFAVLGIDPPGAHVSPWWLLVVATYAADVAALAVAGIRQARFGRSAASAAGPHEMGNAEGDESHG